MKNLAITIMMITITIIMRIRIRVCIQGHDTLGRDIVGYDIDVISKRSMLIKVKYLRMIMGIQATFLGVQCGE